MKMKESWSDKLQRKCPVCNRKFSEHTKADLKRSIDCYKARYKLLWAGLGKK